MKTKLDSMEFNLPLNFILAGIHQVMDITSKANVGKNDILDLYSDWKEVRDGIIKDELDSECLWYLKEIKKIFGSLHKKFESQPLFMGLGLEFGGNPDYSGLS